MSKKGGGRRSLTPPTPEVRRLGDLFKKHFGRAPLSVLPLKGDASDRRLFKLSGGGRDALGVFNEDKAENRAFLVFSRHFRKSGLSVPEIYEEDPEGRVYIEEYLGDTTLLRLLSRTRRGAVVGAPAEGVYKKAAETLPRFQISAGRTLDYGVCYPNAAFDRRSILWDLNYFKYYFLRLAGVLFDEESLQNDFERFAAFLLKADRRFFLYRDFQSRNIMVREGRPWFIDYQGGRKGALQYDIASLLLDAKADLPEDFRAELLKVYIKAASRAMPLDREAFMRHYPGYAYVRIMQAMGTYGLRGFYERKPLFLQSIPYAVRNIENLMREWGPPEGVPELEKVFKEIVASPRLRVFGKARLDLRVRVQSFSYREGLPGDDRGHGGGYVFDCRHLPNPGRIPKLTDADGNDPEVSSFLRRQPAVRGFMDHARSLVLATVENYRKRNFTDLFVAFGCTGGRHRSVYCAEALARDLRRKGLQVDVLHRDL